MIAEVDHKLQAHARVCKGNKVKFLKKQLLVNKYFMAKGSTFEGCRTRMGYPNKLKLTRMIHKGIS